MRFLHTSDLHLNSKMNSKLSGEKAKERKLELLLNFRAMTEFAKSSGCRAFVISGDLFDTEKMSMRIKRTVLEIISSAPDITFLYLAGNHEKDAIASLDELPENLKVFGKDWTYFIIDGTAFAGRAETDAGMFASLKIPSEAKNAVAVLHGELRDSSESGGIIGKKELKNTKISYLALGHYHSFSEHRIAENCVAVYSGTPLGRGFDELGEKGFVTVDIDGENVNYSFQKSNGRKLMAANVLLDGVETNEEFEHKIQHALAHISKNDLVRLVFSGHRREDIKIDCDAISARYRSAYYYMEAKDETRLAIKPEDYAFDKTLKGEFIRTVLADTSLSDGEKDEIITTGLRALMGERFDD